MDPFTQFQDLISKFSTVEWDAHAILGWGLIFFASLISFSVSLFNNMLMTQWIGRQAVAPTPEKSSVKLRKFLFPLFTRDPNDEFKPYISYYVPVGLGMVATFIVGFFILWTQGILMIVIGLGLWIVALLGCYKLAHWQVQNNRW